MVELQKEKNIYKEKQYPYRIYGIYKENMNIHMEEHNDMCHL